MTGTICDCFLLLLLLFFFVVFSHFIKRFILLFKKMSCILCKLSLTCMDLFCFDFAFCNRKFEIIVIELIVL